MADSNDTPQGNDSIDNDNPTRSDLTDTNNNNNNVPDWALLPRAVARIYGRPRSNSTNTTIRSSNATSQRPDAGTARRGFDVFELPRRTHATSQRSASTQGRIFVPNQQARPSNPGLSAESSTNEERVPLQRSLSTRAVQQLPSTTANEASTSDQQAQIPIVNQLSTATTKFSCFKSIPPSLGPNLDHSLCIPTLRCIWFTPAQAREIYAQREHWLQQGKPLEETRNARGRLPALIDEFGENLRKAVAIEEEGQDPNDVWDGIVRERFTAVIKPGELGVGAGEWAAHWAALGRLLEVIMIGKTDVLVDI
ncbi:hypothetical protein Q7P37_008210 [Cladosporium fusiforme]